MSVCVSSLRLLFLGKIRSEIRKLFLQVAISNEITRIDAMTSDWVGHRLLIVAGFNSSVPIADFITSEMPQKD